MTSTLSAYRPQSLSLGPSASSPRLQESGGEDTSATGLSSNGGARFGACDPCSCPCSCLSGLFTAGALALAGLGLIKLGPRLAKQAGKWLSPDKLAQWKQQGAQIIEKAQAMRPAQALPPAQTLSVNP